MVGQKAKSSDTSLA